MPKKFLRTDEVAEQLALTPAGFLARRKRLEEAEDFPLPMPHRARPMLWRADILDAWIADNGRPRVQTIDAPRPTGANVVLMELARTP